MRVTVRLLLSILLVAALCTTVYAQTAQEWIERGYDASLSGNIEEAISCYTKALQIDSQNKYAYHVRAVIKMETGDLKGALSDYNKAIEISPNFTEAYIGRGRTKERLGDAKGAKADFEKAEDLRKRGVDHALEDINNEIEADPKAAKKIFDRALYKSHKHDYKGAVEDFDRYLGIVGKSKGWLVYHHKTRAQEALGDIQGAIDTYSEWIAFYPNDTTPYSRRASLRKKIGDKEGAISDLSTMEEMIREETRQKIEQKTQAIKENPNSYYSYKRRAELRAELGEYEAALADMEKAIEVVTDDRFLIELKAKRDNILKEIRKKEYKESAKSKMELGEYDAALDDLQKALYIQPDDKEIKKIKEDILLRIKEKKEAENLKNKK